MRQPLFAQRKIDGRAFGALLAAAAVVVVAATVALGNAPRAAADVPDAGGATETVLEVADHSADGQPAKPEADAAENVTLQVGAEESAVELAAPTQEDTDASISESAHEEACGDQPILVSDGDDVDQAEAFDARQTEEVYEDAAELSAEDPAVSAA